MPLLVCDPRLRSRRNTRSSRGVFFSILPFSRPFRSPVMGYRTMRTLLGLIALLGVARVSLADAEQVVKDQLAKLKAQGASVQALKEPALGKTFADYEFVSVRFPQFPVARLAPEPLRSS